MQIPVQDPHNKSRFCRIYPEVLAIFAKFVFVHKRFIMTNLHADGTELPYFRCYAVRGFLNIHVMAPNF